MVVKRSEPKSSGPVKGPLAVTTDRIEDEGETLCF
jgi:hypothetical protein